MRSFPLSLVYTILLTIIIEVLLYYLLKKRYRIRQIKNSELKKINQIGQSLIFESQSSKIAFFLRLVNSRHKAEKRASYVIVKHESENVVLFPLYSYKPLDKQDIILALEKTKKTKFKKMVICCYAKNNEAVKFAAGLPEKILILNNEETYLKLMKEYDCYPEKLIEFKSEKKLKGKELLRFALSANKTKGYFTSAIIILFSSFIVRYNIYYVIMSTILLGLALASFIIPKISPDLPESVI